MSNLTEKIQTLFGNGKNAPENPEKGQIKAKQHDEIHGKNKYVESQKETAKTVPYLKAEDKLREKTYAEENYTIKEWVVKIRNIYPFMSVIFGGGVAIFAGWLFADGLPQWLFWLALVAIGGISLAIISLIEISKMKTAVLVFGKNRKTAIPLLILFLTFSIGVSVSGSYLVSYHLNDKTNEITDDFTHQTDSVRNLYLEQINDYEAQIQSAKEVLNKKGNKWLKHSARQDLNKAQTAKTELLAKIKTESSELETVQNSEIAKSDDLNQYKAYILALVVLIFEILYIISFLIEYKIEKGIKTENQNHNLVTPRESPVLSAIPEPVFTFEQQLILGLLSSGNGQNMQNFVQNPAQNIVQNSTQKNRVGFEFENLKNAPESQNNAKNTENNEARNEGRNEARVTLKDGNRICKNCGEIFTYNSPNHKYCSDACRIEAWELRTGKKFRGKK